MILKILHLLFLSLGFGVYDDHTPINSLYPKNNQPKPFRFNLSPVAIVVLVVVCMFLFAGIIFFFAPGTESGLVYNKPLY